MTDKAYFNIKQTKRSNPEARTTLDNLHQIQISQLQDDKDKSQTINNRIIVLTKTIDECNDIVQKTQLEDELESLKKKRDEWNDNKPLYDYFFETGDLLYKYYDLQEKIQKGSSTGASRILKAKPGSVLAALQEGADVQPLIKLPVRSSQPLEEGREILLEKYLLKIDPEHARTVTNTLEDPYGICEKCDREMTFSINEALFFCDQCGYQEFVLIDSDKPSYKDPPREVTYYEYKHVHHHNA